MGHTYTKTSVKNAMSLCATLLLTSVIVGCTNTSTTTVNTNAPNITQSETAALPKQQAVSLARHALYELRTYTTNEGKLDALHARFRDHTKRLFEKHGIANVAYWTPTDKPNTLIYIVGHKSAEGAKASWAAFVADPEWQAAYAASIADGRLVSNIDSVFMQTTDYSQNKAEL